MDIIEKEYKRLFKEAKKEVNVKEIIDFFKKNKYVTDYDEQSPDEGTIDNKKGYTLFIRKNKSNKKLYGMVQGYKNDINLDEIDSDVKSIKKIVDGINKKWMKDNDPDADRW